MTGVPSYSTTPSENVSANTGIDWNEGMSPAQVNNSARQNMTDMRLQWNDASWFAYGTGSKNTVIPVYSSSTAFTVAGIDVTAYWHAGRRVKAVGSGTGTIYGSVSSSSFSTNTTVNITWDSGSLSNEVLAIYAGTQQVTGAPVPATAIGPAVSTSWTPTDASGAGLSLTINSARYFRIGPVVYFAATITYPATANGANATIGGLPLTSLNISNSGAGCVELTFNGTASLAGIVEQNSTNITVRSVGSNMNNVANSTLTGAIIRLQGFYWAA